MQAPSHRLRKGTSDSGHFDLDVGPGLGLGLGLALGLMLVPGTSQPSGNHRAGGLILKGARALQDDRVDAATSRDGFIRKGCLKEQFQGSRAIETSLSRHLYSLETTRFS